MAFNLASATGAAWVAVILSGGGSLWFAASHNGAVDQQIVAIQSTQTATDAHVAKHDDQLTAIQRQQAANAQQLKDIADTVHDMHDNGVKRK